MKKFGIILLLFVFADLIGQQTSDYKYIIVPSKFSDFDENEYRLNSYFRKLVREKGYTYLSEDATTWPKEVTDNPCLALHADIKKNRSLLKNKLEIVLNDCRQKMIDSYEGTSRIKEFDKGYQEALKLATQTIAISAPIPSKTSENSISTSSVSNQSSTANLHPVKTSEQSDSQMTRTDPNQSFNQPVETESKEIGTNYKSENQSYMFSQLKDGSYLIINQENSKVFGQLYPSSRPGVFHVSLHLESGEKIKTTGYLENKNISIDIPKGTNSWEPKVFEQID